MPNTSSLSRAERTFREGSTGTYRFQILQEDGVTGLPAAQINTITLTLKDTKSGTALNTRDAQDVKNKNNVTIDADGYLEWDMQIDDNAIIDADLGNGEEEEHRALFEYTWNGGADADSHEVLLFVTALGDVG